MTNTSRFTLTKIAGVVVSAAIAGGAMFAGTGAHAQSVGDTWNTTVSDLAALNAQGDGILTFRANEIALNTARAEFLAHLMRFNPAPVASSIVHSLTPAEIIVEFNNLRGADAYVNLVKNTFDTVRASGRTTIRGSTTGTMNADGSTVDIVAGAVPGSITTTEGRLVLVDPSLGVPVVDGVALLGENAVNGTTPTLLVHGASRFNGNVAIAGNLELGAIANVEAAITTLRSDVTTLQSDVSGKQNQLTSNELTFITNGANAPAVKFGDAWYGTASELAALAKLEDTDLGTRINAMTIVTARAEVLKQLSRTYTPSMAAGIVAGLSDEAVINEYGTVAYTNLVKNAFETIRASGRTTVTGATATLSGSTVTVGGADAGSVTSTMGRQVFIDPTLSTRPSDATLLADNTVNGNTATLLVHGAAAFTGDVRINGNLKLGAIDNVEAAISGKQTQLTATQLANIDKAGTAVQTVKVNGTTYITDANGLVDITVDVGSIKERADGTSVASGTLVASNIVAGASTAANNTVATEAVVAASVAVETLRATTAEALLDAKVAAETIRATTAEAVIDAKMALADAKVAAETARAIAAEAALSTRVTAVDAKVDAETIRATAAEAVIANNVILVDAKVAAETARATAAEALLDAKVIAETIRATTAEAVIANNVILVDAKVAAETARALAAEAVIANNVILVDAKVAAETARATAAEALLDAKVAAETSRALAAEAAINARVTTVDNRVTVVDAKVDAETSRAMAAEAVLTASVTAVDNRVTVVDNRVTAVDAKVDAETVRAIAEEARIEGKVDAETVRAKAEEARIEGKVDAEVVRSTAMDAEHTARLNDHQTRIVSVEGKTQNLTATAGQTTIAGNTTVGQDLTVGRNLFVKGNSTVDGTLAVKGNASFDSNVVITKDLTVGGNAMFNSNVAVAKDLVVGGNLNVAGNANVDGSLSVAKELIVNGKVFAHGRLEDVTHSINKVERATNVGAAAVLNIIALELTPEALRKEGIGLNATVGANDGGTEVRLGVSKTIGDTGAVASVGVGTESGRVGASVGKTIDVTENIKAGVSASIDSSGFNVGPSVTLHKGGYGIGASTFGPTVMINGVTLPIAGPMAMPNLVVTGVVGAYQAITGKTKAEIAGLKVRAEKAEVRAEKAEAGYAEVKMEMAVMKAQIAAILEAQKAK